MCVCVCMFGLGVYKGSVPVPVCIVIPQHTWFKQSGLSVCLSVSGQKGTSSLGYTL